jgi:hypothetical protein
MAEDKNDFNSILENLALVIDGAQKVFPSSKSVLIYELNQQTFNFVKSNFRSIKVDETQIKIDISGTEILFILENSYKKEEELVAKPVEEKKTFGKKLKNLFTNKKSS